MINGRIELPDIHFEIETRSGLIPQCPEDRVMSPVNSSSFYAGIGVGGKDSHEDRLYNDQDGVMDDSIHVISQLVY